MEFLDEVQCFQFDNLNYNKLFKTIKDETIWEKSMKSRWTASYGKPYNYNDTSYLFKEIPKYFEEIIDSLHIKLGYRPNNCLINYYNNKESKMGYHSDNVSILEKNTGITILSLGSERVMKFKNTDTKQIIAIDLKPNTFFHMSSELQKDWKHSILPAITEIDEAFVDRISVTFRNIK